MEDGDGTVGIAVMAKASAPGRTKTRLVPPLTGEEAAELNTAFLRDVAANLLAAGRLAPVRGYMAYGPPGSERFFRDILPDGIGLIESFIGPFGECLQGAVDALLARGHSAACVLNADGPTLPTGLLVALAEALLRPGDRAVLGPSEDGGYYVLGLKADHRRLFEDITWSTGHVARETRDRAREIGLPLVELAPWYDVDEAETLGRVCHDLEGGGGPGPLAPFPAPSTRALLARLTADPAGAARLGRRVAMPG